MADTVTISIGENCLTDHILARHGLKSFTTPFSHSRSNLDWVLHLENTGYHELLEKSQLHVEESMGSPVVRNKQSISEDPIYEHSHMLGFEFTHHDVLNNEEHRASVERKIGRMLKFRGRKHFRVVYHHRACESSDIGMLIRKLRKLKGQMTQPPYRCEVVAFLQNIVSSETDRRLEETQAEPGLRIFTFFTTHKWAGDDDQYLWALADDDLVKQMIRAITTNRRPM